MRISDASVGAKRRAEPSGVNIYDIDIMALETLSQPPINRIDLSGEWDGNPGSEIALHANIEVSYPGKLLSIALGHCSLAIQEIIATDEDLNSI